MSNLDPEQVREWKSGYEAMNRFVDNERLATTVQERYQSLKVIWAMARELRLSKPRPDNSEIFDRWQALREAYARVHG